MVYKNQQTGLTASKESDKNLIINVITTFLETHDEIKTAEKTGVDEGVVKILLSNRNKVLRLFDKQVWDSIVKIRKANEEKLQEQEYEQLTTNVLFLMINSLYNTNEICEKLHIHYNKFMSIINNEEYIEKNFGIQMLDKLRQSRELRDNLVSDHNISSSTNEIVKTPECRQIIKPNIIKVGKYEHQLIKKAALFLEYNGDSKEAAINSSYSLNEIITSIKDIRLKDLLLENVYEHTQKLLEIDSILTQNRISECKKLVKSVIVATHEAKGNLYTIIKKTGYSEEIIRRVLKHPCVGIICNSLDISVNLDMLYYKEETKIEYYSLSYYNPMGQLIEIEEQERKLVLGIADYIIENKCSYSKAAEKFKLSKKTICLKMKDKLPHVSKEKSEKVNEIVSSYTAKSVKDDENLQERVLLESKIFLRGYTLEQVAYLTNNSYSSTQRDLSKRLPQIDEEKGQLVKTMLKNNQLHKNS